MLEVGRKYELVISNHSGLYRMKGRFSAYDVTREEATTIHGNNERIRLDALGRSVEFFTRLLWQC